MTRPARPPGSARTVLGAVLLAVAASGWSAALVGLGTAAAAANPTTSCTPSHGTIVAVDFGHWGGPVVRGCGVDDASAYELLHDGGFTTTGTQHDGPGFVCRIGSGAFHGGIQYPTPAQDPCVNTPPASAYWTFWVAEPGQNGWTYGRVGAVSYQPQPGEVEVWLFGATPTDGSSGAPPYSPASLRAPPVAGTTTAAPPPPAHPPAATRTAAPVQPPPSSASTVASTATKAAPGTRPASTPYSSTSSRPASAPTGRTTPMVVAASPAAARPAAGSATPALLGATAVAVLAAAAGGLAWRRRSQRQ
jgi:hypothetical protein